MSAPSYSAITEPVEGSSRPVTYQLAQTWDGLYVPYALRLPSEGATGAPFVFLAYGTGGGGLDWLRGLVVRQRPVWVYRTCAGAPSLTGRCIRLQSRRGAGVCAQSHAA
jgi:hypothetical protein